LAFVVFLVFLSNRKTKMSRLTPLASIAFGCVLAGVFFFRQSLFLGYILIVAGIVLSIIDIYNKSKADR